MTFEQTIVRYDEQDRIMKLDMMNNLQQLKDRTEYLNMKSYSVRKIEGLGFVKGYELKINSTSGLEVVIWYTGRIQHVRNYLNGWTDEVDW